VAGLEKVLAEHAALDAIGRARGELPLLRPELPAGKSGPIGTTSAAKRLISCLRKGCGQDPLGVDDMYFPLGIGPKTGLMKWSKKGGTGKNENFHGNINRLVHGVARLSSQACDARLLQRVHRHNHDMDRKHGFASKHSTLWPWRERDANDAAEKCVAEVPFPKAGPRPKPVAQEHFEPMGFEYAKRKRTDQLQKCRNDGAARAAGAREREAHGSTGGPSPGVSVSTRPPPLMTGTGAAGGSSGAGTEATRAAGGSAAGAGAGATRAAGGSAAGAMAGATRAAGGSSAGSLSAVGGDAEGVKGATNNPCRSDAEGTAGQAIPPANYGGSRCLPSR
ncbi:unnamed protein product, partial [Pylaiella littoralis]